MQKKRILLVKITNSNVNKLSSINLYFLLFFFLLSSPNTLSPFPFLFEEKWEKENNIFVKYLFFFFCAEGWKIIKSAEVYDTMGSKQIIINILYFFFC